MPHKRLAPITSPTFSASNRGGATRNHHCGCETRHSTNSPPTRSRWPNTMLSFCVPERNPMTSLHQKLNQLSLMTMSRQLDQTISEAAAKNFSLTQALESLLDLELESRNRRSIERRFRL